jgi:hypothetical protein
MFNTIRNVSMAELVDFVDYKNDHLNSWSSRLFIFIYSTLFVVGLVGNFVVIYFVLFYKRLQTMTNKFITNLSVADLLVIIICIPVTASRYVTNKWIFGEIICRTSSFIQGFFYIILIFNQNIK